MAVRVRWNAIGRTDAPVTVVEFTDYQCPFCKRFHVATFTDLKKKYIDTGRVRWVIRDLPLDFHPYALQAAEAVQCAGEQGQFWQMHDALLSTERPPDNEVINASAERLSLNLADWHSCLQSGKFTDEIQKEVTEAAALQFRGTPTFIVARTATMLDGEVIVGAKSLFDFQSIINGLLRD
jgi:protein-disulfide isomerase